MLFLYSALIKTDNTSTSSFLFTFTSLVGRRSMSYEEGDKRGSTMLWRSSGKERRSGEIRTHDLPLCSNNISPTRGVVTVAVTHRLRDSTADKYFNSMPVDWKQKFETLTRSSSAMRWVWDFCDRPRDSFESNQFRVSSKSTRFWLMEVKVANLPRKVEDRSDNGREFESQLKACLILLFCFHLQLNS